MLKLMTRGAKTLTWAPTWTIKVQLISGFLMLFPGWFQGCAWLSRVVSQFWLDSDLNESSQSWVGRENQGYELSQSRITPIVIWVTVESTGYRLSQSWMAYLFWRKNDNDFSFIITGKGWAYSCVRPHPLPSTTFGQIIKLGRMWWVVSLNWLHSNPNEQSELSQVSKFEIWVESEYSQSRKIKCWVESHSWIICIVTWVRVEPVRKNISRAQLWLIIGICLGSRDIVNFPQK